MAEQNTKQETDTKGKQTDDGATDDGPLTMTKAELQKLIDENRAEAAKEGERNAREKAKLRAKRKQEQEGDDAEDDDEQEDTAEIIRKAELKAAEASQRADEAEKKALLADVKGKLVDWLGLNARPFIGNAVDIMAHIEKQITAGMKEGEIARIIEANAKAFVERTKSATKVNVTGNPTGARNRIAAITGGASDNENDRAAANVRQPAANAVGSSRPFSTINWHG